MAKEPAFLFYSSDFLTGVQFFTDAQTGQYIKLLCLMHQHGRLTEKQMTHICGTRDSDVLQKFTKDDNGLYYNARLDEVIDKRTKYSESRRDNRLKRKPSEKAGKKAKATEILFTASEIGDIDKFRAVFGAAQSKYKMFNHEYYYEAVLNWAEAGMVKRSNWTATARGFMLRDSKDKKAVLKGQNLLSYGQQTNNREQQYEAVERALAARYSGNKSK